MRRGIAVAALAVGAIAAAASSCGSDEKSDVHGINTHDARAVAGAYVLDWLRCTDQAATHQYDLLADPTGNRAAYARSVRGQCRARGAAQLQPSVVSARGHTRVVAVRYRTEHGSGSARVHLTDAGDGYRVDRPVNFIDIEIRSGR